MDLMDALFVGGLEEVIPRLMEVVRGNLREGI